MRLYLKKDSLGLHGSNQADQDKLDSLKDGYYRVDLNRPRNVLFHRKFFAMINIGFSLQDEFKTLSSFLDAVKIKAGHCTLDELVIPKLGKVMVCKPSSISFAAMDDSQFEAFYSNVVDVMIECFCPGQTSGEIDEAALKYLEFV